jgi:hypothetical protein
VLQEIDLQQTEQELALEEVELPTEQVDTRWWLPRREGLFARLAA